MADPATILARLKGLTAKNADNDCWHWTLKVDEKGRGRIWIHGRIMLAHRAMWEAERGPIPAGMLLCHHCDNAGCVNLDHIYVGTHADNMRDMRDRKRYFAAREPERVREIARQTGLRNTKARGEGNPKAKLTAAQAASIRADTRATRFIATEYGVDRTTIQKIRRGDLW